eukprot:CAMPEP_0117489388 /NCGR_PEP_ID=MMETSP0784-20121206/17008_1 /TAXON_ID=39447 /ORGANISM="" /LENGTH=92 /DNA_ID=CAMNT_0005284111 /DNA_START=92 /DNA_END=367 /DNA_ORIENTATION=+
MAPSSSSPLRYLVHFVSLRALVPHNALALHHGFAQQSEVATQRAHLQLTSQRHRQLLHNDQDMLYTAAMTVGGQEMEGVLDTGSFELLVFST